MAYIYLLDIYKLIDQRIEDAKAAMGNVSTDPNEIKYQEGEINGRISQISLTVKDVPAANYAFDVTPARMVTALITEKGICQPNKNDISNLFPEKFQWMELRRNEKQS